MNLQNELEDHSLPVIQFPLKPWYFPNRDTLHTDYCYYSDNPDVWSESSLHVVCNMLWDVYPPKHTLLTLILGSYFIFNHHDNSLLRGGTEPWRSKRKLAWDLTVWKHLHSKFSVDSVFHILLAHPHVLIFLTNDKKKDKNQLFTPCSSEMYVWQA